MRERGIALVVVLWSIALLSVLAGTVLKDSRLVTRGAAMQTQYVQAKALAEGAVHEQIARMLTDVRAAPGAVQAPAAGAVEVRVEAEIAKVDLNWALAGVLQTLFATHTESDLAKALTARVEDWRDADDDPREQGAERGEYLAAGALFGPRNGRFEHPTEIAQLPGVDAELGRRLAPLLTVHSHRRQAWLPLAGGPGSGGAAETIGYRAGQTYTITARARVGPVRATAAVKVLLAGRRQIPYRILAWEWIEDSAS